MRPEGLLESLKFSGEALGGETPAEGGGVAKAKRFVEVGSAGQWCVPALLAIGRDVDSEARERVLEDEGGLRERRWLLDAAQG